MVEFDVVVAVVVVVVVDVSAQGEVIGEERFVEGGISLNCK